jgi:hypothetical protein
VAITPITSGSGVWTVEGPDFIKFEETPNNGPVHITIDLTPENYLSASPHFPLVLFREPAANQTNFGFREDVDFTIYNHLGVPLDGLKLVLFNEQVFAPDTTAVHPVNYAHFHGVQPTTFSGMTTSVEAPNNLPGAFGPPSAQNVPVPEVIHAVGTLLDGQLVTTPAPIVLHGEEVANRDDNFYLSIAADLTPENLQKVVDAVTPPSPSHTLQIADPATLLPTVYPEIVAKYTGQEFLPLSHNVISGLTGGPDKIFDQGASDSLIAGNFDDVIVTGDNTLGVPNLPKPSVDFAPTGDDFAFAGEGNDLIVAKAATATTRGDYVEGWKGIDTIYGGQAIFAGDGDDTVHAYDGVGAPKGPVVIPGAGNDQVYLHEAVQGVGAVVPNTLLFEHENGDAAESGNDTLHNFQHGDTIAFRDGTHQRESLGALEQVVTVTGNNEHFTIAFNNGSGSVDVFTPYASTPDFHSLQDIVNAGFKIDMFHDLV